MQSQAELDRQLGEKIRLFMAKYVDKDKILSVRVSPHIDVDQGCFASYFDIHGNVCEKIPIKTTIYPEDFVEVSDYII